MNFKGNEIDAVPPLIDPQAPNFRTKQKKYFYDFAKPTRRTIATQTVLTVFNLSSQNTETEIDILASYIPPTDIRFSFLSSRFTADEKEDIAESTEIQEDSDSGHSNQIAKDETSSSEPEEEKNQQKIRSEAKVVVKTNPKVSQDKDVFSFSNFTQRKTASQQINEEMNVSSASNESKPDSLIIPPKQTPKTDTFAPTNFKSSSNDTFASTNFKSSSNDTFASTNFKSSSNDTFASTNFKSTPKNSSDTFASTNFKPISKSTEDSFSFMPKSTPAKIEADDFSFTPPLKPIISRAKPTTSDSDIISTTVKTTTEISETSESEKNSKPAPVSKPASNDTFSITNFKKAQTVQDYDSFRFVPRSEAAKSDETKVENKKEENKQIDAASILAKINSLNVLMRKHNYSTSLQTNFRDGSINNSNGGFKYTPYSERSDSAFRPTRGRGGKWRGARNNNNVD